MALCRTLLPASLLGTLLLLPLPVGSAPFPVPPDTNPEQAPAQPNQPTAEPTNVRLPEPRYIVVPFARGLMPTDINNNGEILFSNGALGMVMTNGVTAAVVPVGNYPCAPRVACALNDQRDVLLIGSDGAFLRTADKSTECLIPNRSSGPFLLSGHSAASSQSISNTRQCFVTLDIASTNASPNIRFVTPFMWDQGRTERISGKYVYDEMDDVISDPNRSAAQTKKETAATAAPTEQMGISRPLALSDANDAGQIAGFLGGIPGKSRAAFWDGKRVRPLPVLGGSNLSYAYGLNNANEMVGYCRTKDGERATMWRSGGVSPVDLNRCLAPGSSGLRLDRALRINDSGCIIGIGRIGFRPVYFVLVPVVPVPKAQPTAADTGSPTP